MFKEERPRVPAGHPDGGEWLPGGGDKHPNRGMGLRQTPNIATEKRARVIYGETSGLRPQLINPKISSHKPSNWRVESAAKLHRARTYVGVVSERNSRAHSAKPSNGNNPVVAHIWSLCVDAAIDAGEPDLLDPRITSFFLRQEGIGRQNPGWTNLRLYFSIGPFNNLGGGDVARGSQAYIDFYGRK